VNKAVGVIKTHSYELDVEDVLEIVSVIHESFPKVPHVEMEIITVSSGEYEPTYAIKFLIEEAVYQSPQGWIEINDEDLRKILIG
jgi:hypothetical protein